jgi:peptide/nickel transport system permease protein
MQYVLRRLALMPLMLLGITLITYVLISLAPGDPVTALINPEELNIRSPEEIEAIRESLGLNFPSRCAI